MAIEIKNNLKIDSEDSKFVGIEIPFSKSDGAEGYFKSNVTTTESVKNNIRCLLNTNKGERLMQPTLGISLDKFLFNQFNDETKTIIRNEIEQTFLFWLPFVSINNLNIEQHNENQIKINIEFFINDNRNTLDSIDLLIGTMGV